MHFDFSCVFHFVELRIILSEEVCAQEMQCTVALKYPPHTHPTTTTKEKKNRKKEKQKDRGAARLEA